jgi:structure-specific recognition protein 1
VRCSYKADDGYLYPLTGAFFFVHKPPLQLPYEDVDSVEFARQQQGAPGGAMVSAATRTFDLVVRMRGGVEHQFRGIQRTEWQGLFDWVQGRGISIENVDSARRGPGGHAGGGRGPGGFALGDDDGGDGGGGAKGGTDEEESDDSDFEGGSASSSEDEDEDEDGSGSGGDGSEGAEMVSEEGVSLKPKKGKKQQKKRKAAGSDAEGSEEEGGSDEEGGAKAAAAKKKTKKRSGGGGEDGDEPAASPAGKKKRAKKDPNAPKKALSAFMYFSNAKREEVKAANPGIAFGDVGKALGERWRALGADERREFDEAADRDKERYARAMQAWKGGGGGGGGASGGGAAATSGDEAGGTAATEGGEEEAAAAKEEEEEGGGGGGGGGGGEDAPAAGDE